MYYKDDHFQVKRVCPRGRSRLSNQSVICEEYHFLERSFMLTVAILGRMNKMNVLLCVQTNSLLLHDLKKRDRVIHSI